MKEYLITRRSALLSLSAAAVALAQGSKEKIPVRGLNHVTLRVADVKRSVDFYQGLFGMPIQHRQSASVGLRLGSGPQYLSLSQAGAGVKPGFAHYCMSLDDFNVDRLTNALLQHGLTKGDPGPMKIWVEMRDGTPEFYIGDPDGVVVQLQDAKYCGGSGALGDTCKPPEASPTKGLIAVQNLSHFTLNVTNADRANQFYQNVFGLNALAHQGTAPALGVGSGTKQFLMMAPIGAPGIGHGCFNMENFDPDKVMKILESYGIKPRGTGGPTGPMRSYVTLRMANRGGAPEGTPELYFTDPDGILMQIQDVKYCGGAGSLGEVCV